MSPTKVQPGRNAKSCHQMIKGMTVEECEQQYLNSFHTKMVTLNNGQQLHPSVALQQLHTGLISKDEIAEDGDCDEVAKMPVMNCKGSTEDEGADTDNDNGPEESSVNLKCGRLPMEAICQVQALGMCTTQEAQAIADKYGKTLILIMTAAGLTSKATWAESVWNLHQAWYVHANPKASGEHMKDYYSCQAKHYKDHKDEEEYPQLWVEICMFWSESISGTKDTSSKAMVGQVMACRDSFTQAAQTWCNVEGIHVFGCVIYSGSDEAAHQAQGIFAGSPLCMQLASTIMKYKVLDSAASVPLPNFTALLQVSYDWALALKPQESRHDCNHHVLPVEQMGVDYHAEAPGEEEDQDGPMIVLSSLFHLKKWTPDSQAFLGVLPRGLLPPRNWLSSSLPPSSPPEESPQPAQSNPSSPSLTDKSPQLPVRRHVHILTMCRILVVIPLPLAPSIIHTNIIGTINSVRVIMMHPCHREGTIIALFNMSIKTFHATEGTVPQ
ncbi:hypothetical protein F5141DRAFT_1066735 [Pisolithus sp. B1]|nr:hypothetical protein F5141DRAFT_1066735 [Pisolithus sp. B1]